MNVTSPCLHHCIMCQLIRAQWSCFTNGCSIYVYGTGVYRVFFFKQMKGEVCGQATESGVAQESHPQQGADITSQVLFMFKHIFQDVM